MCYDVLATKLPSEKNELKKQNNKKTSLKINLFRRFWNLEQHFQSVIIDGEISWIYCITLGVF